MPLTKSENQTTHASPSDPNIALAPEIGRRPNAFKAYLLASRPKTWIASVSPVLIGTALAAYQQPISYSIFTMTLFFSLFIQIGTNYANDYFDFMKGADTKLRNGPKRATQEGWITPFAMFVACLIIFGLAILVAIPLMIIAGLWSFAVAALCVAFGILYTGGPKPLGYLGLGELLVFVFFGPVAVCGTYFLQTQTVSLPIFISSLAPGFLSCAILIANNLRDEKTDRLAGKNTLIVRFGRRFGSWEYTLSILAASLVPLSLIYFFDAPLNLACSSLIFFVAIPAIKKAFYFEDPLELISVLQKSALLLFLYTLLFSFGLW